MSASERGGHCVDLQSYRNLLPLRRSPSGRLAGEPGLDACLMKDFDLEDRLSQVLAAVLTRHGSAR